MDGAVILKLHRGIKTLELGVSWHMDMDRLVLTNHRSGTPQNMFLISN